MFTWISDVAGRRLILALTSGLMLAACTDMPAVTRASGTGLMPGKDRITVAQHSVVIAGPLGYCVDSGASHEARGASFVLLGRCNSVVAGWFPSAPMGLLTALVSAPSRVSVATSGTLLAKFFATPEGRAALARDGQARSVTLLETRTMDATLVLHLRDASGLADQRMAPDYWRAVFDLNGRMITVSVMSFADRPLAAQKGLATLRAFVASTRAANANAVSASSDK